MGISIPNHNTREYQNNCNGIISVTGAGEDYQLDTEAVFLFLGDTLWQKRVGSLLNF